MHWYAQRPPGPIRFNPEYILNCYATSPVSPKRVGGNVGETVGQAKRVVGITNGWHTPWPLQVWPRKLSFVFVKYVALRVAKAPGDYPKL